MELTGLVSKVVEEAKERYAVESKDSSALFSVYGKPSFRLYYANCFIKEKINSICLICYYYSFNLEFVLYVYCQIVLGLAVL